MELRTIELSDRKNFEEAYSQLKLPLADLSFSMMMLWKDILQLRWAEIRGNLCVFGVYNDTLTMWGPPLPGKDLLPTLADCFMLIDEYNNTHKLGGKPAVCYIPEELKQAYGNLEGYELVHQNQDYVYKSIDLIEHRGEMFKSKRNMINSFLAEHKPEVEIYEPAKHKQGCLALLKEWQAEKEEDVSESVHLQFASEATVAKRTIEFSAVLGLKGMVVMIDGKVQAFTFGDRINSRMCNIIIEKTNLRIKGLAQFIYQEFIRRCWSEYELVNAQEDWGVAYLQRAKLSYHPAFLLRSYYLQKR